MAESTNQGTDNGIIRAKEQLQEMGARNIFKILLVVALLPVLLGSFYTVNQGDRAVVLRYGAIIEVAEPGLHFKLPLIDSVVDMSVREFKVEYKDVMSYSKDVQAASLKISINAQINPASVAQIYTTYGKYGYVEKVIDPQVLKHVKEVFGTFTAVEVVSQRQRLGAEIAATVSDSVRGTGIIVRTVQIENVDFSDEYEKAIEARMKAEVEVTRARQELERARVYAEKALAEARGQADAKRAIAEAEAFAIRARGEALRQNPALVEMTLAEKWDGKLPVSMVPGSATPFVHIR